MNEVSHLIHLIKIYQQWKMVRTANEIKLQSVRRIIQQRQ